MIEKWKRLDLRSKVNAPCLGELVAIRMYPKNDRSTFYRSERYEIGRFEMDGGKLWWKSSRSTEDPVKIKQHYDVWWCPIPAFDGI